MTVPPFRRIFAAARRTAFAVCAIAAAAPQALAAEEGGEGGGKKSIFDPGEHVIQMPPLWVPVANSRTRTPGVAVYRPVTLVLTSQTYGMMTMCYKLPYLTEAFLFDFQRAPLVVGKDGKPDFAGIEKRLLADAQTVTGPLVIRSVAIADGVPPAARENHDILAKCR